MRKRTLSDAASVAACRTQLLGDAWELGGQGYYAAALEILETLLLEEPRDIGALRLKGNVLELKELDLLEYSAKKLASSVDFLAARGCYESILRVDPHNVKAHIDLGDHYRNLQANDKALSYYREAMKELQARSIHDDDWNQDLSELAKAVESFRMHERLAAEAGAIDVWCKEMIENAQVPSARKITSIKSDL